MAKTDYKSVEEYLAAQPEAVRPQLEAVRRSIRHAIPTADEVISYQLPTYKMDGRAVIYFAGWKRHYAVYPATEGLVAAFEQELAPYEVQKGTIRFPYTVPVPAALIERIAAFRAAENAQRPTRSAKSAKKSRAIPTGR